MRRDYGANLEVKRLLEERGLRADWLAARSGIPYKKLCHVLRDKRPLYADELLPLARVLGVSAEALLGLPEEDENRE